MIRTIQAATAVALLVLASPALAYPDGHALLGALDSDDPSISDQAIAYVRGVFHGYQVFNPTSDQESEEKTVGHLLRCVNVPDTLTSMDIAAVVRIWLRRQPPEIFLRVSGKEDPISLDPLEQPAPNLVVTALRERFPCD